VAAAGDRGGRQRRVEATRRAAVGVGAVVGVVAGKRGKDDKISDYVIKAMNPIIGTLQEDQ